MPPKKEPDPVNTKDLINEGSIAIALVLTVAALVVVVIASGVDAVAATGLRDLALLLGGALAGTKIPKQ
jgi:hypothetical protein